MVTFNSSDRSQIDPLDFSGISLPTKPTVRKGLALAIRPDELDFN